MMLLKSSLLLFVFSIFLVQAKAQDFVGSIKASLDRGQFLEAQAKLKQYRDSRGVTPEYLEDAVVLDVFTNLDFHDDLFSKMCVPPFRGSDKVALPYPGLAPWAETALRRSAAET